MDAPLPTIAVLGASGLIGEAVATRLSQDGFSIVPIARRFTAAQRNAFGKTAIEYPFVTLEADALARIFADSKVDIVVNCVGVLQDGPRGGTQAVHRDFVARLLQAIGARGGMLIHVPSPAAPRTTAHLSAGPNARRNA